MMMKEIAERRSKKPSRSSETLQQIKPYAIKHNGADKLSRFSDACKNLLQQAVNHVRNRVEWLSKPNMNIK